MAQICVTDLTFSYEGSSDYIFENVSFSIDTDWKLGLTGRNGKGKTTFLNLLLGKYSYTGKISTRTVFDYFPYPVTKEQTEQCAAEFLEELKASCELWKVLRELEQMSEDAKILYRPFGTLSPGERTRILLAVLFSGENEFLLIDEPTNHLDQEARETVKRYLSSKKSFLLVSHDRDLMDACIDHILVLNRKTIEVQKGNFSCWWENKQRRDRFAESENEKHLKEIRKLRQASARASEWAEKSERSKIGFDPLKDPGHGGKRAWIGAKTKKMQSRAASMQHRMEREIREKEGLLADLEQPADLKMMPAAHPKETLVHVREYTLWYTGSQNPVLKNLTFDVKRGDRIALHGKNGCGKSTLIKRILQKSGISVDLSVTETGICETASGLTVSFVDQNTSMLRGSVSRFCEERGLEERLFCSVLRNLDLDRIQFSKNMEDYSEGQKKKVLLAAGLLTPAHLYVWDEPLNYVDVFSRMQIEKLLLQYRPTMLFVEHDTRFREKIATAVVEL